MEYYFKIISSPVGKLRMIATGDALVFLGWERDNQSYPTNLSKNNNHPILLETEKQLNEYFNRKRKTFTIKLDFEGTDFRKKVWNILLTIPYGETTTYGQIAKQLGDPKASQAVGAANGKNPIAIIAPCHRVIGSSGKMVGFGGGIENKILLLDLENPNILAFK